MTESNVKIRQLRQDDFAWLVDYDCRPLTIERDSVYLFFCVHFARTSFVALDESGVLRGFLLGFLPAGSSLAYVHYLFVEASWRRRGIGRALVSRFEVAVADLGANEVTLYTARASDFYAQMGYQPRNVAFEPLVLSHVECVKRVCPMTRAL